eukprot:502235-Amphidinium_carterae.1
MARTVRYTKDLAPGPGPIIQQEWLSISEHTVTDFRNFTVMCTDSARACQARLAGVHRAPEKESGREMDSTNLREE